MFYITNFLGWDAPKRPIVVGPITGLLLGDLQTGIIMGASLEAVYMGISNIGGVTASDPLSGTIAAVAYAIIIGGEGAIQTGIALSVTIGSVIVTVRNVILGLWGLTVPYWERLAQENNPRKFYVINILVGVIASLPEAIMLFFGIGFGVESLQSLLEACPAWVMTGLAAAGSMMTAVGLGILLSQIWSFDIAIFFFVGFVLTKTLGIPSLGVAVIGAGIALLYFFIEKDVLGRFKAVESTAVSSNGDNSKPANTKEDFF